MITRVTLRGEALARAIADHPPRDRDRFVDDLLGLEVPAPSTPGDGTSDPELIGYVPSGVSAIADAILETRLGARDVFCDVGAGTGRVAILAHLLTGARAVGVELRPDLVEIARRGVARLGIDRVTVANGDARHASLDGDVFYLYLPCIGTALRDTVRRLERVAAHKPIRIATLGVPLRDQPWLRARDTRSLWLDAYETHDAPQTLESPGERLPSLGVIASERRRGD